jgi:lipoprotein-anchoring transpeptidase ErfK/SrfK
MHGTDLPRPGRRGVLAGLAALAASACARTPPVVEPPQPEIVPGYGYLSDHGYNLPPIPPQYLVPPNRRAEVDFLGDDAPGSIVVDPHAKFLFLVEPGGRAIRYPIAVGREGRGFRFASVVGDKRVWPGWAPTANMLRVEPEVYGPYRGGIPGGLRSPLGARALYLYRNGRDSRFRIHGTNDLEAIGNSGTAGCIRLFNHDVIELYDRVPIGTRVRVRSYEESVRLEGEEMANRGVELPARIIPPEELLGPEAA